MNTERTTQDFGKQDIGFWRTVRSTGTIAAFAIGAVITSTPAQANNGFDDAYSLRSLDIMLMVTSLRCRSGAHDSQSDDYRFSANHLEQLNAAGRTLKRSMAANYGEKNPEQALDRMGVRIANSYGGGHPWLDCAQLQQVTRDLSHSSNAENLLHRARYLLSATRPVEDQVPFDHGSSSEPVQITYNMTADWEKRP